MYLVPMCEQRFAVVFNKPHAFADVGMLHADGPDQFGLAARTGGEIYLCLSIAEDMYMCRLVIVRKDHDPETRQAQSRDHGK
jgi:hypothetical protein